MKKGSVAKVLLANWEIILHENNRNQHSYRFITNLLLSSFVLSCKPKIRIRFSASWWSGTKRCFCFLLIVSRALLQSHVEFNRLKGIFLHVTPVRILVSWCIQGTLMNSILLIFCFCFVLQCKIYISSNPSVWSFSGIAHI